MNFFAEFQICGLSFSLLLTPNPEEIFINKRVNIALKVDLLLHFIDGFVKFVEVDFHPKDALLKLHKSV